MNDWNLKLKYNNIYISTKTMTYLGIDLTKYAQYINEKNYKTLMTGIKNDLNK